MNENINTIKQVFNSKRAGQNRKAFGVLSRWLLALARLSRPRWILPDIFTKESKKGSQSRMVCCSRYYWYRMVFRPHLSSQKLCQSVTSEKSYTLTEYSRKQQKHPSLQRFKNTLQKWTPFRQTLFNEEGGRQIPEILFNMSSRKDQAIKSKVGEGSFIGGGLIYKTL